VFLTHADDGDRLSWPIEGCGGHGCLYNQAYVTLESRSDVKFIVILLNLSREYGCPREYDRSYRADVSLKRESPCQLDFELSVPPAKHRSCIPSAKLL
jgi:hypothetical protein